eukprot:UN23968
MIDGNPVQKPISFPIPTRKSVLPPPSPSYIKENNLVSVWKEFIPKFFNSFDSNRANLLNLYAPKAIFSLTVIRDKERRATDSSGYNINSFDRNLIWCKKSSKT